MTILEVFRAQVSTSVINCQLLNKTQYNNSCVLEFSFRKSVAVELADWKGERLPTQHVAKARRSLAEPRTDKVQYRALIG